LYPAQSVSSRTAIVVSLCVVFSGVSSVGSLTIPSTPGVAAAVEWTIEGVPSRVL
jgi:hypothetical protein